MHPVPGRSNERTPEALVFTKDWSVCQPAHRMVTPIRAFESNAFVDPTLLRPGTAAPRTQEVLTQGMTSVILTHNA